MSFTIIIFLGILQGLTEFLPISSSGHLLLAEHFFALDVENLKAFDVVLHAGTLVALLALFWREWFSILKFQKSGRRLFLVLILATIPAAFVGLFFGDTIDTFTRGENRVVIVASFFVVVALALFFAEKFGSQKIKKPQSKNIFWMSIFQALALLPGISRSGATIVAGMFSGLDRSAAARFSFLMLAPATAGATLLTAKNVFDGELVLPPLSFTLVGFAVSAVVSFAAAAFLLHFVKKYSLKVFSVYLIFAAAILFAIA